MWSSWFNNCIWRNDLLLCWGLHHQSWLTGLRTADNWIFLPALLWTGHNRHTGLGILVQSLTFDNDAARWKRNFRFAGICFGTHWITPGCSRSQATELTWTRSTDSSLQKKIKKIKCCCCYGQQRSVGSMDELWELQERDCGVQNLEKMTACPQTSVGGKNANRGRWLLTGSWNSSHSTIGCETHTIILTSEDCRLESRDFQDFSRFLETIINL